MKTVEEMMRDAYWKADKAMRLKYAIMDILCPFHQFSNDIKEPQAVDLFQEQREQLRAIHKLVMEYEP